MEKAKFFVSEETIEKELEFEGTPIKLKIKPLTWSKKNQILSRCFTYSTKGDVQFNLDKYMKEVLCEIIVEAPWGETNQIFLNRVKPEFGNMLEKLVPRAFEEGQPSDFFGNE